MTSVPLRDVVRHIRADDDIFWYPVSGCVLNEWRPQYPPDLLFPVVVRMGRLALVYTGDSVGLVFAVDKELELPPGAPYQEVSDIDVEDANEDELAEFYSLVSTMLGMRLDQETIWPALLGAAMAAMRVTTTFNYIIGSHREEAAVRERP